MGEIMKKLILETKRYVFAENEFFPSCHASTVLPLGNGDILTACFGGTYEKHDDVEEWQRERESEIASSWYEMKKQWNNDRKNDLKK